MQLTWRTRLARRPEAGRVDPETGESISALEDLDDAALARSAIDDTNAFGILYERYEPIVYHYCLRRLSDPEAASDTTATIFTRALAGLPDHVRASKRRASSFRSWLFAIAHNIVVDVYRRQRADLSLDRHAERLATSNHLTDRGQSPEDHAIQMDDARRFRALLACLPERQRAVIELRLSGLTGAEIAGALVMTESAVKSAQFRAFGTLRDLIDWETIESEVSP